MDFFKSKEEKEQEKAIELGLADNPERRTGAPKLPEPKSENICVVEGCHNEKALGQTYVCTEHVRAG